MKETVDETIKDRDGKYGSYCTSALYAQQIKTIFQGSPSWEQMNPAMRESLDLIATKLSRVLTGDPFYDDSWHDIAGYAKLVEDEIS